MRLPRVCVAIPSTSVAGSLTRRRAAQDQIKRVLRAAQKAGVEITLQLDIVHVLQNTCSVRRRAFHPESSPEAEKWVEDPVARVVEQGDQRGTSPRACAALIVRHDLDAKAAKPVIEVCELPCERRTLAPATISAITGSFGRSRPA